MPARKNIKSVARICLQKPLKVGPRRCIYRRWEAEVKGKTLITKTTKLERMYRGNTPYPLRKPIIRSFKLLSLTAALNKLSQLSAKRRKLGFETI
jgi:hypothetical protein